MTLSIAEVVEIAGRVPAWRGKALEAEALAGGITNRNFVVTVDGGARYVVRFPGERAELLGIDRGGEREAALRAAALGIGPAVVGELPSVGTPITELVPGRHLDGRDFGQRLDEVVDVVRRFHDSGPLGHAFAIHRVVEAHARDAARHGIDSPPAYQELAEQAARIEAAFAAAPSPPVPCHNDLLPANVLFGARQVWLLDFEYAGVNDRFFDLANLSVNAGLDHGADERLLARYFGAVPTPTQWARLQLMKMMSELREGLWALVQQAISTLDTDFVTYADERLASARRLVSDTDYERWLREASRSSA